MTKTLLTDIIEGAATERGCLLRTGDQAEVKNTGPGGLREILGGIVIR